eukprot:g7751.t1
MIQFVYSRPLSTFGNVFLTQSKQQLESLSLTLALVVKSGKYSMGFNQALKNIRSNKAKLVLISNNTPALRR